MANNGIVVRGAREHNLTSIDVELPWDACKVVVLAPRTPHRP
jgi:excinuclease UvrABC ATPase subunit